MAIIPKTPISLLRLLHDPGPSQTSASNLDRGQAQQRRPSTTAPRHQASFDGEKFRDNLAILHTLVFELRQEVADLHYRVEATEVKVAEFLQILASMHDALIPDPEEASPEGDPELDGVIAQIVGWEKPDPIHKMAITVGESTHCHLR
jgi:hypothetical protein